MTVFPNVNTKACKHSTHTAVKYYTSACIQFILEPIDYEIRSGAKKNCQIRIKILIYKKFDRTNFIIFFIKAGLVYIKMKNLRENFIKVVPFLSTFVIFSQYTFSKIHEKLAKLYDICT